jgi:hypothetical protein
METIDGILKFAGSYPMWARLLVLVCLSTVVATLVLVPRSAESQGAKGTSPTTNAGKKEEQVYLRIRPIRLFPEDPSADVQVSVFVNGIEYKHPSVGGVQWMKTGPGMSEKIIEIPRAERYDVRFEMRIRDGATLQTQRQASQMVTPVKALPYSEEYKLYNVRGVTRAAGVSAVIAYEIYAQ